MMAPFVVSGNVLLTQPPLHDLPTRCQADPRFSLASPCVHTVLYLDMHK
jgi:hypothetical protein